jgi:aerobic-type carbon monoxide dehydrogenase small subunit (CoxS/CutS family)
MSLDFSDLDRRMSLLDVLRERLHLGGTKKGCNQGACGACTILVNGRRVVSCLTLAAMHDGAEITTVKGLRKGDETASAADREDRQHPTTITTVESDTHLLVTTLMPHDQLQAVHPDHHSAGRPCCRAG